MSWSVHKKTWGGLMELTDRHRRHRWQLLRRRTLSAPGGHNEGTTASREFNRNQRHQTPFCLLSDLA